MIITLENYIEQWEKIITRIPQFSENVKVFKIKYKEKEKKINGYFFVQFFYQKKYH